MAQLYADENVSFRIVRRLQALGHDVLTALADGKANQNIVDLELLIRATELNRIVLTNDRDDFHRLHDETEPDHPGIITYTDDEVEQLTNRIHEGLEAHPDMTGKLLKIKKPNRKNKS